MKLKTKIQLYSSLFMLGLILIVNIAVYYFFYSFSTENELEELNLVTNDVITALNSNPEVDPGELMNAYLPANGMIRVIAENGVPFLEQTRSKDYLTLSREFTRSEEQRIVERDNGPDAAVIEKPVIWPSGNHQGEVVTLQVSNRLAALHETMRTLLYVLGLLSIVILIPVILAGSMLSRFLLSPIQNLIATMKGNMTQGEWQKIESRNRSRDEIYEMEETFNEMIDRIKLSYEKQEMFVSDASHELKTPVQVIKSYAQLLQRRQNAPRELYLESLEAINSETDRVKKLVDQMLTLAKNKQDQDRETFSVASLAEETVERLQGIHNRRILLHAPPEHLKIHANKDQIHQVITILLDNALKYSEMDVEVEVFKQGRNAVITVRDYGKGISHEEQKRIFDRFYRVDKARSRDTGGTGLGLSIARAITDIHGGKLTVASEIGSGSTFTLQLPLSEYEDK